MKKVLPGPTGYLTQHARVRRSQQNLPEPEALAPKKVTPKKDPARALTELYVPSEVAKKYTACFKGAEKDLTTLSNLVPAKENEARSVTRILSQIYRPLGTELSFLSEAKRPEVACQIIKTMADLSTKTSGPHRLSALQLTQRLLDATVRWQTQERLKLTPQQVHQTVARAADLATNLLDRFQGCNGSSSALALATNLIMQGELATDKLTFAARNKIWTAVETFLCDATPKPGLDPQCTAELAELVAQRLKKNAPAKALASAQRDFVKARGEGVTQALKQLDEAPNGFKEGSPELGVFNEVNDGLKAILEKNPTGPAKLVEAVETLRASLVGSNRKLQDEAVRGSVQQLNHLLTLAADSPAAEGVARQFNTYLREYARYDYNRNKQVEPMSEPTFSQPAKSIGKAKTLAGAAKQLVRLEVLRQKHKLSDCKGLEKALNQLAKQNDGTAMQIALAMIPVVNGSFDRSDTILSALLERAETGPHNPSTAYAELATRFTTLVNGMRHNLNAELVDGIASQIVQMPGKVDYNTGSRIGRMLTAVMRTHTALDPNVILLPSSSGRPGLAQLTLQEFRFRPEDYFPQFLNAFGEVPKDKKKQEEQARFAIDLTERIANLDGELAVPLERIKKDLERALKEPKELSFAERKRGQVDARAGQKKSLFQFIKSHPSIPIELAATAGLHLKPDQLTWLEDSIEGTTGRDSVRALRDMIFGAVTTGQLAVIDAIRSSTTPKKAISETISYLAREYRAGRAAEIPWQDLVDGLNKGKDTLAELERARVAKTLKDIDFKKLVGNKPLDEAGMAEISKTAEPIANLLAYYKSIVKAGQHTDNAEVFKKLTPILLDVIKSVADGTWPTPKYENAVGKRQLAVLSKKQQAIWREETIEGIATTKDVVSEEKLQDALTILKGLQKAIPEQVQVDQKLTQATQTKLRKEYDNLLGRLRRCKKGSKNHKTLGAELGRLRHTLAIVELQVALTATFKKKKLDARATLLALKPLLTNTVGSLGRVGARGCGEAVQEVLQTASGIKTQSRQGRYAVDEDGLNPMIASHTSGCLNNKDGFRRWGLTGAAADANIKMLRVYEDDRQLYRTFIKFLPVKLEGYEGPALWLDNPRADGGGSPDDKRLLYRCAIKKATAMGIPVIAGTYGEDELREEGEKLGRKTHTKIEVTFSFDEGNTGVQHSDALLGGYGNIAGNLNGEKFWDVKKVVNSVVMPP